MSITDELREYIRKHTLRWANPEHPSGGSCAFDPQTSPDMLRAIADRIDAEHESVCAEAYGNGVMSVPIALDENAWVELPKDADEVPWNVGDRDEDGNVVTQLRLSSDGWYAITDGLSAFHPEQRRHHHAPTVEDVLREFADEMNQNLGMYTGEAIDADEWRDADAKTVEKYAAKLRLAEGED